MTGPLQRFTAAQISTTGRFLARVVVETSPDRRQRVLRTWTGEIPSEQIPAVVSALVLALADVLDACCELSPRAREYVRDQVQQKTDPFSTKEATRG